MDRDKFLEKVSEIGTTLDEVERRVKLTELSDSMTTIFDEIDSNKTTIETLNTTIQDNNTKMEKLREENMKLFLRVTEPKTAEEITAATTGIKEPVEHKRKFDDLFNEKGELKL